MDLSIVVDAQALSFSPVTPHDVPLLDILPTDVLVAVLTEWLPLKDVAHLDTALLASPVHRQAFLNLISQPWIVFEHVPTSFQSPAFFKYVQKRHMQITNLIFRSTPIASPAASPNTSHSSSARNAAVGTTLLTMNGLVVQSPPMLLRSRSLSVGSLTVSNNTTTTSNSTINATTATNISNSLNNNSPVLSSFSPTKGHNPTNMISKITPVRASSSGPSLTSPTAYTNNVISSYFNTINYSALPTITTHFSSTHNNTNTTNTTNNNIVMPLSPTVAAVSAPTITSNITISTTSSTTSSTANVNTPRNLQHFFQNTNNSNNNHTKNTEEDDGGDHSLLTVTRRARSVSIDANSGLHPSDILSLLLSPSNSPSRRNSVSSAHSGSLFGQGHSRSRSNTYSSINNNNSSSSNHSGSSHAVNPTNIISDDNDYRNGVDSNHNFTTSTTTAQNLRSLSITGYKKLEDAVLHDFLSQAAPANSNNHGQLEALDVSGCWRLSDTTLSAVVNRHRQTLKQLNLTACFALTSEGLGHIFSDTFTTTNTNNSNIDTTTTTTTHTSSISDDNNDNSTHTYGRTNNLLFPSFTQTHKPLHTLENLRVFEMCYSETVTDTLLCTILKHSPCLQELKVAACVSLTDAAGSSINDYGRRLRLIDVSGIQNLTDAFLLHFTTDNNTNIGSTNNYSTNNSTNNVVNTSTTGRNYSFSNHNNNPNSISRSATNTGYSRSRSHTLNNADFNAHNLLYNNRYNNNHIDNINNDNNYNDTTVDQNAVAMTPAMIYQLAVGPIVTDTPTVMNTNATNANTNNSNTIMNTIINNTKNDNNNNNNNNNNWQLQSLLLDSCAKLTASGISHVLQTCPSVTHLSLRYCPCVDMRQLSKCLRDEYQRQLQVFMSQRQQLLLSQTKSHQPQRDTYSVGDNTVNDNDNDNIGTDNEENIDDADHDDNKDTDSTDDENSDNSSDDTADDISDKNAKNTLVNTPPAGKLCVKDHSNNNFTDGDDADQTNVLLCRSNSSSSSNSRGGVGGGVGGGVDSSGSTTINHPSSSTRSRTNSSVVRSNNGRSAGCEENAWCDRHIVVPRQRTLSLSL